MATDPKGVSDMVAQLAEIAPFAMVVVGTSGGAGISVGLMYTDDCPDEVKSLGRNIKDKLEVALRAAEAELPPEPKKGRSCEP